MLNNYKLDKIKNAKTLSEQKNRTKDLLTTTDFIFQNQDMAMPIVMSVYLVRQCMLY